MTDDGRREVDSCSWIVDSVGEWVGNTGYFAFFAKNFARFAILWSIVRYEKCVDRNIFKSFKTEKKTG